MQELATICSNARSRKEHPPHIGRLGMWKQEEKGGLTSALDVVVIRRDRIVIKEGLGEDLLDMLI